MQCPKGKMASNNQQSTTQYSKDWETRSQTYLMCFDFTSKLLRDLYTKFYLKERMTRYRCYRACGFFTFYPLLLLLEKFSINYYYYLFHTLQPTFDFFPDRSKNPDKSLLLSVLPAIAKKSYIDVGTTPCASTNIGKIIRISYMMLLTLFIISFWFMSFN